MHKYNKDKEECVLAFSEARRLAVATSASPSSDHTLSPSSDTTDSQGFPYSQPPQEMEDMAIKGSPPSSSQSGDVDGLTLKDYYEQELARIGGSLEYDLALYRTLSYKLYTSSRVDLKKMGVDCKFMPISLAHVSP